MQKVLNGISNIVASISLTLNEVKQNQSNSVSKKEFQDLQTSISGSLQTMATEIQQLNFAISGLRGSVDTLTIAKRGRAPVAQPSVIPVQVMPPQPTVQLMQPVPVQPANAGSLATSGRFGGAPEGVTSSISSGSSRSASEVLSRESSEGQSEGAANAFKLPDDVWTALSNPKKKPGARAKKAMTEFSSAVALIQKLSPDSLRKQGATEADLEEVYEKLEGWNKLCSDDIATVFNAFATALGKSAETRTNVEESSTRTTSEKTKASRRKRP